MSLYFSKFMLNTYCEIPYFSSHLPPGYQLSLVLQKCRAFRRLPPNLRQLSKLSKVWADTHSVDTDGIERWYDEDGYELDPDTSRRLSDAEIDAQWGTLPDPSLSSLVVKDIPIPPGGFPDPDTWEEPKKEEPPEIFQWGRSWSDPDDIPTLDQLISDAKSRGREAVAETYGIPLEQVPQYDQQHNPLPDRYEGEYEIYIATGKKYLEDKEKT